MRFLEDIKFSVNKQPWWRYIDSITRRYSLEFSLEMVLNFFIVSCFKMLYNYRDLYYKVNFI